MNANSTKWVSANKIQIMPENEPKWISVEITADKDTSEAIEFALNSLDALGTAIDRLRKEGDGVLTVSGYFNERPDDDTVNAELGYALDVYGLPTDAIKSVVWNHVEDRDWLAEWKKHWKPTAAGRFVVAPTWYEGLDENGFVIRIEPKMAFGTGTHATTRLCLEAIEKEHIAGRTFLDVGTGTGVLAIAAAILNGNETPSIVACDTDTESVIAAKENAEFNGVADRINFYEGSIGDNTEPADLVCANLTIDVILPLLDLLLAKSGRRLILSGILREQEQRIVNALAERGHISTQITRMDEWIGVTVNMKN